MHKRLQYLALKSARLGLGLLLGMMAAGLTAQTFPSKPMKLIAPYAVGGAADLMARYVCEKFQQASSFGQPCVVETAPAPAASSAWKPCSRPMPMVTPWP